MTTTHSLKARSPWYPLRLFIFAVFGVLAFQILLRLPRPWAETAIVFGFFGLLFLWALRRCRSSGTTLLGLLGDWPRTTGDWRSIVLTLPLMVFGTGCFWLFWLPISYFAPEFTFDWALFYEPTWNVKSPWSSAVDVLLMILIGPFVEEVVFRGVLIQRWSRRLGSWGALLASGALFGVLHADILGATAFGMMMGLLYARTGGLWVPIICHVLNNTIAFALEFTPLPSETTVAEFQSQWPIGLICLLAGGLIFFLTRREFLPSAGLVFPDKESAWRGSDILKDKYSV